VSLFLFDQFTEFTLISPRLLFVALSIYTVEFSDHALGEVSSVLKDSWSVEIGDNDAAGDGVLRDSSLFENSLLTLGGFAQAPCNTGALISVFNGGGGIGSGLIDNEGIGDGFLGVNTRFA
jgi:hypothetical protein